MALPHPPTNLGPPGAPPWSRRQWLAHVAWLAGGTAVGWAPDAQALPARTLAFPRDHGSHPALRTEWWYITGYAQADDRLWGFQVTFFRSRVDVAQGLQSAFAARQLLFAHAALTDVQGRKLHHADRVGRAGFGVAQALESDTGLRLYDWSLVRTMPEGGGAGSSRYHARVEGDTFGLDLQFASTQPVLLQGQQGLSRKGPEPDQASYYYSQPQLAVRGNLRLAGRNMAVQPTAARAWMDHEWSESLLHPQAVGWDWIGMNLDDGSALTAFRLRRQDGTALWAGGSYRRAGSAVQPFAESDVVWSPRRWWTSALSGARYPVEWAVDTPAGPFTVRALLDDQELDSRSSTGAIYWEGLSELLDAQGRVQGRGYLEMTGYASALKL